VEYSHKYPFMWTSVGLHPEEASRCPTGYLAELETLAKSPKCVAIGEIGLDYHYDGYVREDQIRLFEEQLDLAKRLEMPVIIHSREATADCMELLKKYRPRGVMHCFSGSAETAKEVLALGMYISFTGVVTFKNAKKACEAAAVVPFDKILLETDCPYMSPEPNRGKRCDSTMIADTAAKIAEIKGIPTQDLIDFATENTCRLFDIPYSLINK
ncbi:MAG: TatD family hydrolase, partial [Oscillospiraceae bacterium]